MIPITKDLLVEADHTPSNFLKAAFNKFYLVHSWILCPIFPFDDTWNILILNAAIDYLISTKKFDAFIFAQ